MFCFFKSSCLTLLRKPHQAWGLKQWPASVAAPQQSEAVINAYNLDFWRTGSPLPTLTPAAYNRISGCFRPESCGQIDGMPNAEIH